MKKIKYLVFALLLFFPISVFASCTSKELSRFRKLAGNVVADYYYEYGANGESGSFTITFNNLFDGLYVRDDIYGHKYMPNNTVAVATQYNDSETYRFAVRNEKCGNKNLATFYVKLPSYNPYYKEKICEGYSNLSVCQKWTTRNYNEDEIKDYIAKNTKKEETNKVEKERVKGLFDYIYEFTIKYYYIIIPVVIIILIVALLIYKQKKKKDTLF